MCPTSGDTGRWLPLTILTGEASARQRQPISIHHCRRARSLPAASQTGPWADWRSATQNDPARGRGRRAEPYRREGRFRSPTGHGCQRESVDSEPSETRVRCYAPRAQNRADVRTSLSARHANTTRERRRCNGERLKRSGDVILIPGPKPRSRRADATRDTRSVLSPFEQQACPGQSGGCRRLAQIMSTSIRHLKSRRARCQRAHVPHPPRAVRGDTDGREEVTR
jgi:hypothetical protein